MEIGNLVLTRRDEILIAAVIIIGIVAVMTRMGPQEQPELYNWTLLEEYKEIVEIYNENARIHNQLVWEWNYAEGYDERHNISMEYTYFFVDDAFAHLDVFEEFLDQHGEELEKLGKPVEENRIAITASRRVMHEALNIFEEVPT